MIVGLLFLALLALCTLEMGSSGENCSAGRISPIEFVFDFESDPNHFPSSDSCLNFSQAIADFDLSVFGSLEDINKVDVSRNSETERQTVIPGFFKKDSLVFRVSQLEDRLGIFYLSFWGLWASRAAEFLSLFCRENFNLDISERDFVVVHQLNAPRVGVLIQLSSLQLKQQILSRGVKLAIHRISVSLD